MALFNLFGKKDKHKETAAETSETIEALKVSEIVANIETVASEEDIATPIVADVAVAAPEPEPESEPVRPLETKQPATGGFFEKIRAGLAKTRSQLGNGIENLLLGAKQIDDDLFEQLETLLLMADVGVDATTTILQKLTQEAARKNLQDPQALQNTLRQVLEDMLTPCVEPLNLTQHQGPFVILMVGVNGAGKTTTIGKLCKQFQAQGKSVMLAAGDTFRAAAVEQLQTWGERHNVPVVAQHTGADSASVIFDAVQSAQAKGIDILIADTAGRLQNKSNLMDELSKVVRVMKKLDGQTPHEVMLVLDAGTGQNALSQVAQFTNAVGVTGLTLTKLDGTAKGGIVFALAQQSKLPIRFIGVGEKAEDLRPFNAQQFIDVLFDKSVVSK